MTPPRRSLLLLLLLQTGTLFSSLSLCMHTIISGYNTAFFFCLAGRNQVQQSQRQRKLKLTKSLRIQMPPSAHKLPSFSSCILYLSLSLLHVWIIFCVCVCAEMFSICVSGMTLGRLIKKKILILRVVKRYKYLLITALALFLF